MSQRKHPVLVSVVVTSCTRKSFRRQEWVEGGGIDDDGQPNAIPEPALFRPLSTSVPPGPQRVEILARRHELRTGLWAECDASVTTAIDYVCRLLDLAQFMKEAVLAERCVRWGADGISTIPGAMPGDPVQYRAQIWDPGLGPNGDHIEIGRAKTRGEAVDMIAEWHRRYCRIDTYVRPPDWLRACLADANEVQAELSERNGGMKWETA